MSLKPVQCPECGNSDPARIKVAVRITEQPTTRPGTGKVRRYGWQCLGCGHEWEDRE